MAKSPRGNGVMWNLSYAGRAAGWVWADVDPPGSLRGFRLHTLQVSGKPLLYHPLLFDSRACLCLRPLLRLPLRQRRPLPGRREASMAQKEAQRLKSLAISFRLLPATLASTSSLACRAWPRASARALPELCSAACPCCPGVRQLHDASAGMKFASWRWRAGCSPG